MRMLKRNRISVGIIIITVLSAVILYFGYQFRGEEFIASIYNGESAGIFNKMIEGQSIYPLEFYIGLAEKMINKIVFFALLVIVIVTVLVCACEAARNSKLVDQRKLAIRKFVYYFPLAFILFAAVLMRVDYTFYRMLFAYEQLFEHFQAGFYFLASIMALEVAVKCFGSKEKVQGGLYSLGGLALLFIFFEEISWGQHYLGFTTPSYFAVYNTQKEITIHNLEVVWSYVFFLFLALASWGAIARGFMSKSFIEKYATTLNFYFPKNHLIFYFMPMFLYRLFIVFTSPIIGSINIEISEIAETLCSAGVFLFVWENRVVGSHSKSIMEEG